MATAPARRNIGTVRYNRQPITPLQILLQMGFPKHRGEKALAATGEQGVHAAVDWLLAHVNDTTLDDNTPREYILYLCPTGPFLEELEKFSAKSLEECERNGSHNYMPHITLCSFFQAPDHSVTHLVLTLSHVAEKLKHEFPEQMHLEHYTSPTFLGLFVSEEHNELLKRLAVQFMREASEYIVSEMGALDVLGTCFPWCSSSYPSLTKSVSRRRIQVEPFLKDLHVTLAYQFLPEHYAQLEKLSQEIDLTVQQSWELRLYSRDQRIKGNDVYKVLYSYVPQEQDELELVAGDFIYANSDVLSAATDGWVEGTSWLTGCSGLFPKEFIDKGAESDTWTLHKSIPLDKNSVVNDTESCNNFLTRRLPLNILQHCISEVQHKTKSALHSITHSVNTNNEASRMLRDEHCINIDRKIEVPVTENGILERGTLRKLFIVRHAERMDFTFGNWVPLCFLNGIYMRKDLNMPSFLYPRATGPNEYIGDCPLTQVGLLQATLTGQGMKECGVTFYEVYCSPSLRCVQTCTNILKAVGQPHLKINIEPGLFEWLAWYQDRMPTWMSVSEMTEAGFCINEMYTPVIKVEELQGRKESAEEFYIRSHQVTEIVLRQTTGVGGNILFVGHAATLDSCIRQLVGKKPCNHIELTHLVQKVPYCSVGLTEEQASGQWTITAPPFPPLMHASNVKFDWKVLLS